MIDGSRRPDRVGIPSEQSIEGNQITTERNQLTRESPIARVYQRGNVHITEFKPGMRSGVDILAYLNRKVG